VIHLKTFRVEIMTPTTILNYLYIQTSTTAKNTMYPLCSLHHVAAGVSCLPSDSVYIKQKVYLVKGARGGAVG